MHQQATKWKLPHPNIQAVLNMCHDLGLHHEREERAVDCFGISRREGRRDELFTVQRQGPWGCFGFFLCWGSSKDGQSIFSTGWSSKCHNLDSSFSSHILPLSSIYSSDIITPFPSSYLRHISCTLLITRTSILGWCHPVSMPSFLDSFWSRPSYLLLITRTSILGWCCLFVHVPLPSTYLKCCSLVACTLDLTFWVIQPLNIPLSFWLFKSPEPQFTFMLEDLPVSLFLLHRSIGHRVDLLTI